MKKLLLFLSVTVTITCSSQIAGYMGKRCTIGYGIDFFPALKGPSVLIGGSPANELSPGFNAVHCLNIDYTIHQSINFCIGGQYLRTGINYLPNKYSDRFSDILINYKYPDEINYYGSYAEPAVLTSYNASLGFKFFRPGSLAPLGKYTKLEVVMFFENVKYDKDNFKIVNTSTTSGFETANGGAGVYTYKNFAIAFTFGRQRILADKFVLDFGTRFGIAPSVLAAFLHGQNTYGSGYTMEDSFRAYSQFRIFREQLVNVHIGLGFLAF